MADRTDNNLALKYKILDLNNELLINLVRERPVLWDKTTEEYKDKRLTFEAWREIFALLNRNFEKMGNTEKHDFGHLVMKRWTALRDSWMKCHKRMKKWKPESGLKPCKKYIYYDDMKFLGKVATQWDSDSNDNTVCEDNETEKLKVNSRKRQRLSNVTSARAEKEATLINGQEVSTQREIDNNDTTDTGGGEKLTTVAEPAIAASSSTTDQRLLTLHENQEESRAMAFFRGLAPIVDKFSDEEMVDFQFEVIKAARAIQKRRNAPTVSVLYHDPLEYKPDISSIHDMYTHDN